MVAGHFLFPFATRKSGAKFGSDPITFGGPGTDLKIFCRQSIGRQGSPLVNFF